MKIKVCGLRRIEDALMVNQYSIDYAGFIFAKSKRLVDKDTAHQIASHLEHAKPVGVFVNEDIDVMIDIAKSVPLHTIQLHGDETQEVVDELRKRTDCDIWKAIRIRDKKDLEKISQYDVDAYVLDAFSNDAYGGTGKTFNHEYLKNIDLNHCFIAGGVSKVNVKEIIQYHPLGVDISSSIETDGYKDKNKLREFMEVLYE